MTARLPLLCWLSVVITCATIHAASPATILPEWRQALDRVTKAQTQKLLQLDELLLGEILQQLKTPAAPGDAARRTELQVWQLMLSKELGRLQKGGGPEPVSRFESKRRFFEAADGLRWQLNGTRNVKGFTITNGILSLLLTDGSPPRPAVSGILHAAGVISHDRSDRSRTYYLISPDLTLAHCVIASQLLTGYPVPAEAAAPPLPPAQKSTAQLASKDEDVIDFTLAKRRSMQASHARERWKVLSSFYSADMRKDASFASLYAETEHEIAFLDGELAGATQKHQEPSMASFNKRAAGLQWRVPKAGEFERLRFDGTVFELLDESGAVRRTLSPKVIWPGLFRLPDSQNQPFVISFAADLSQVFVFRSRGEYTGQRAK